MRITVTQLPDSIRNLLRSAGYSEYLDRNTGKYSFAKRLGQDLFPKFHLYTEERGNDVTLDLHIDQKQVSYEGGRMHSGEYEGPLIERELERVRGVIERARTELGSGKDRNDDESNGKTKGFFASLFG